MIDWLITTMAKRREKSYTRSDSTGAARIWHCIHCVPKNVHLFGITLSKMNRFQWFLAFKIMEKIYMKILQIFLHQLSDIATLPWEIKKKLFSTILFIRTSDYFCYLRRKQTVIHLPIPPENVTTLTCELQTFASDWRFVAFFQTLEALKRASCGLSSVALIRTCCHVWQVKCQASNVTASVQSDHLMH